LWSTGLLHNPETSRVKRIQDGVDKSLENAGRAIREHDTIVGAAKNMIPTASTELPVHATSLDIRSVHVIGEGRKALILSVHLRYRLRKGAAIISEARFCLGKVYTKVEVKRGNLSTT